MTIPTREELERIDREIAEKVMGWTWTTIQVEAGMNALGDWSETHEWSGPVTKPGGYFPRHWCPSVSLTHAFEVVEKMRDRFSFTITVLRRSKHGPHISVGISMATMCEPITFPPALGESLPLVICEAALAALKAVQS